MEEQMTAQQMQELIEANLYKLEKPAHALGRYRATPNYVYCRADAPVYAWTYATHEWVQVDGKLEA